MQDGNRQGSIKLARSIRQRHDIGNLRVAQLLLKRGDAHQFSREVTANGAMARGLHVGAILPFPQPRSATREHEGSEVMKSATRGHALYLVPCHCSATASDATHMITSSRADGKNFVQSDQRAVCGNDWAACAARAAHRSISPASIFPTRAQSVLCVLSLPARALPASPEQSGSRVGLSANPPQHWIVAHRPRCTFCYAVMRCNSYASQCSACVHVLL